jgi:hypothetical protein
MTLRPAAIAPNASNHPTGGSLIMLGTDTRQILGEVRHRLNMRLRHQYPNTDGPRGFLHTTEPYFIRAMYGIDVQARRPDYYIAPGDGAGPIIVEIGSGDETWAELVSIDMQPVRLLRVGRDGVAKLLNPRHTQFENDLMLALDQVPDAATAS